MTINNYLINFPPLKKYLKNTAINKLDINMIINTPELEIIIDNKKEKELEIHYKKKISLSNYQIKNLISEVSKVREKYLRKAYAKFERKSLKLVDETPLCYNIYYNFKINSKIICSKENIYSFLQENHQFDTNTTILFYLKKIDMLLKSLYYDYTESLNLIK